MAVFEMDDPCRVEGKTHQSLHNFKNILPHRKGSVQDINKKNSRAYRCNLTGSMDPNPPPTLVQVCLLGYFGRSYAKQYTGVNNKFT